MKPEAVQKLIELFFNMRDEQLKIHSIDSDEYDATCFMLILDKGLLNEENESILPFSEEFDVDEIMKWEIVADTLIIKRKTHTINHKWDKEKKEYLKDANGDLIIESEEDIFYIITFPIDNILSITDEY